MTRFLRDYLALLLMGLAMFALILGLDAMADYLRGM